MPRMIWGDTAPRENKASVVVELWCEPELGVDTDEDGLIDEGLDVIDGTGGNGPAEDEPVLAPPKPKPHQPPAGHWCADGQGFTRG